MVGPAMRQVLFELRNSLFARPVIIVRESIQYAVGVVYILVGC